MEPLKDMEGTRQIKYYYEHQSSTLKHVFKDSPHFPPLSDDVEERLQLLTRIAEVLELDDLCFSSYSNTLTGLSSSSLSLKRSILRLEQVKNELQAHLANALHEERLITRWTELFDADETATADEERRKDALIKKAMEYKRELDALTKETTDQPRDLTVTALVTQQDRIRKQEQEIKAKRAKIKAFQGLSPNLESARTELRSARNELMELTQLRERLLGRMADGVA